MGFGVVIDLLLGLIKITIAIVQILFHFLLISLQSIIVLNYPMIPYYCGYKIVKEFLIQSQLSKFLIPI